MPRKLEFSYCECGCHCLTDGPYHIYDHLDGRYTLWEGRFRDNFAEFTSYDAAKTEAQRRFDAKARSVSKI